MSSITLPLYEPILNTYNIYGSVTSMLSNNDKYLPWLYNNFIQIRYVEDWDCYFFDHHHILFDNVPFINHHLIPRDILTKKWSSLTEFIKESLQSNYYVYLYVDRYFISVSKQYQQFTDWHEIFVYGYDEQKQTFQVADNLSNGKYIKTECPMEEIEKAYLSIVSNEESSQNIHLFSLNEIQEYPLQVEQIAKSIEQYLDSSITPNLHFKEKTMYGLKAVEYALEKEKGKFDFGESFELDRRAFHLFWEHKKIMLQRLRYLMDLSILKADEDLLNQYNIIVNHFESMRNSVLRFNLDNNKELFYRIENKLFSSIELERRLLRQVMNELNQFRVISDEERIPR
ncbi:BtrH N-terminal domain-containing protein [Paenibacillus polysaccharolyticus]|uniref:BtrH N-terminal domain-containing protein n=1 Tax=Paenibacillus polysaccharolyticus TaxID=582692 RepID=UPI00203CF350|nr:BtrH N-terminal domain-containing protein [Paenibacillus polysaccharolyticus]MCM3132888.1 BtrH N-terminal domain-containing protein [Paenibacillus polysaccharolyticus]